MLNSHILTAQRLADQLADPVAKQKAYEEIIQMTSKLILPQVGAVRLDSEKTAVKCTRPI